MAFFSYVFVRGYAQLVFFLPPPPPASPSTLRTPFCDTALPNNGCQAFAVEIGFTAALVFMISALTDPSNAAIPDGAAPALIGATVTTLIVGGGPITGQ